MKIIRNRFLPFNGFNAINLFGILFVREYARIDHKAMNHERIHSAQMAELLFLPFYVVYLAEWIYRVLFSKDRFTKRAYYHLSFEQEAYRNERNEHYLKNRKHFAQWRQAKNGRNKK